MGLKGMKATISPTRWVFIGKRWDKKRHRTQWQVTFRRRGSRAKGSKEPYSVYTTIYLTTEALQCLTFLWHEVLRREK